MSSANISSTYTSYTPSKLTANVTVTPETKATKAKHRRKRQDGPFRVIAQTKSGVKYLRDMASPTSIFAAVDKFKSMSDALHNSEQSDHSDFHGIAMNHFRECSIFKKDFEGNMAKSVSTSLAALESSFHKSVRHLCRHACFLRAYAPIREHCFLWRDLIIDDIQCNFTDKVSTGQHSRASELTKAQVLGGWRCQLIHAKPPAASKSGTKNQMKRQQNKPSICTTTFVSPNKEEFATRAKVEKHLNELYADSPISFHSTEPLSTTISPLNSFVTSINPLYSPLGLLEELFIDDPWKMLVSTILLNKTQRPQVDCVLYQFLQRWPDAESTACADADDIFEIIGPLGLGNKRSQSLIRFSKEYIELIESKRPSLPSDEKESDVKSVDFSLNEKEVKSLHQCGAYAWSAYQLFILQELPTGETFTVCDHALTLYVEHKLGVSLQDKRSRASGGDKAKKKKKKKRKINGARILAEELSVSCKSSKRKRRA